MSRSPLRAPLALTAFLTSAALTGIAPAEAAPPSTAEVYTTITGPEMVGIMKQAGYRTKLDKDSYDDPRIRSEAAGVEFYVTFYDCDNGPEPENCGGFSYTVTLDPPQDVTLEQLNEWNLGSRFVRMALDSTGNIDVRFDLTLFGGVTEAEIVETLATWSERYASLLNHIDWPR